MRFSQKCFILAFLLSLSRYWKKTFTVESLDSAPPKSTKKRRDKGHVSLSTMNTGSFPLVLQESGRDQAWMSLCFNASLPRAGHVLSPLRECFTWLDWSRGMLPSEGTSAWLAEGRAARLPPKLWPPTNPLHGQGVGHPYLRQCL